MKIAHAQMDWVRVYRAYKYGIYAYDQGWKGFKFNMRCEKIGNILEKGLKIQVTLDTRMSILAPKWIKKAPKMHNEWNERKIAITQLQNLVNNDARTKWIEPGVIEALNKGNNDS